MNIRITILDIIHSLVFYLKCNVSETGLCLHLQVEHIQLDPLDRDTLSGDRGYLYLLARTKYVLPEYGDRMQSPKRCVLNKRQDDERWPKL
jgi:hypothetical protein